MLVLALASPDRCGPSSGSETGAAWLRCGAGLRPASGTSVPLLRRINDLRMGFWRANGPAWGRVHTGEKLADVAHAPAGRAVIATLFLRFRSFNNLRASFSKACNGVFRPARSGTKSSPSRLKPG